MNQPHDPNATADIPVSSVPPDSLDAGLAAGLGGAGGPPRSGLDPSRPRRCSATWRATEVRW
jgi:hypothetical protein